ncbi:hypothetical protein LMG28140_01873 [Paraburkholderia metrosideri]|uniref:Uncharacterized protein n=1 Tax=Paraburkholderia metrosideri TaxID=580937 RepID=A0ABM8NI20_9BURK|nr:hypothetical protein LMG28140_01873 [Paraburkholderia metrosideri]
MGGDGWTLFSGCVSGLKGAGRVVCTRDTRAAVLGGFGVVLEEGADCCGGGGSSSTIRISSGSLDTGAEGVVVIHCPTSNSTSSQISKLAHIANAIRAFGDPSILLAQRIRLFTMHRNQKSFRASAARCQHRLNDHPVPGCVVRGDHDYTVRLQ